jgi:3-methyladenine DNA glycosylase AlkD
MKNLFPFWGIPAPAQERIAKELYPQLKSWATEAWLRETALLLYKQAKREFHYFAVGLLRKFPDRLIASFLPTVEQLVQTHSWWDTIDPLAYRVTGGLVLKFPELLPTIDTYSTHENLWLRRVAILQQLDYKKNSRDRDCLEILPARMVQCPLSNEKRLRSQVSGHKVPVH